MAYTIVKTDGTVLTTIPDGTINTTSTSIGLPGRNYAGYGQQLDTNFVHTLENFAAPTPPSNPLRGQLWFNTNNSTLYVCPADGTTSASSWLSLTSTSSGGTTTFGAVSVTGNVQANNLSATNGVSANVVTSNYLTISANATIANASIANANVTTLLTVANITSGGQTTPGNLTGGWTVNGSVTGNALVITNGNLAVSNSAGANLYGILCDRYMYANGTPISFAGTYSNSNVQAYLPTYSGNVGNTATASNTAFIGTTISTGANTTLGSITGNWSLTTGSRLNATYADLAERFAADDVYDAGTVVSLGGDAEITAVQYELSEDVFGVISDTAAYLMNAAAGDDDTHPAVAVSGRVPVKVLGSVKKGDRLVSAGFGLARAAKSGEATPFNVIGRALEDKNSTEIGFVEAFVTIK
jgi:Peptidase_G2, IMC autoproteolytic cleavage domain